MCNLNLRSVGGEREREKGIEEIYEETTATNFLKLITHIKPQIQDHRKLMK